MYLAVHVEEQEVGGGTDSDGERTLLSVPLAVSLKQLEFPRHRSVLHMLERRAHKPAGNTLLGLLHAVMQQHGWQRKHRYQTRGDMTVVRLEVEATPQAPCVHDYRLYNMLALDAQALERVVRRGAPRFDIARCMRAYCRLYKVKRSKTFPSLQYDIANHGQIMDRSKHAGAARGLLTKNQRQQQQQQAEDDMIVCCDNVDMMADDDDSAPFIYDNAVINVPGAQQQQQQELRVAKRKGQKRKGGAPQLAAEQQCTRLIPISVLPLLLPLLPACYTRVNEILHECEQLETRLWRQFTQMAQYPRYVQAQVEALAQNRRHVARLHQQAALPGDASNTAAAATTTDSVNDSGDIDHNDEIDRWLKNDDSVDI